MLRSIAISLVLASAFPCAVSAQLTLPYQGSASVNRPDAVFKITNTASTGYALLGRSDFGVGVGGFAGDGVNYGVWGESASTSGTGVYGFVPATSGTTFGGQFFSASQTGFGVYAGATATTGVNHGGLFFANGTQGIGVSGIAFGDNSIGGSFSSDGAAGYGLFSSAGASSGTTYAGYFYNASTAGTGVKALAVAGSGFTNGGSFESASPDGNGVYARATATTGQAWGVIGETSSPEGLGGYFTGPGDALWATTAGGGKSCVIGLHSGTGDGYGLYGQTNGTTGAGVFGRVYNSSGPTLGGLFVDYSTSGTGAAGYAYATSGGTVGVAGECRSASGAAVKGVNVASNNTASIGTGTYGVIGTANSAFGMGVRGDSLTSSGGVGVYGRTTNSTNGFGVYSLGRFGASGTKSFRIDHPLDPENAYLNHYCTESPEVLNSYRGTVTLDGSGGATVQLPPYFALINRQPSYTLTAVGAPMPLLHIAQEIDESALAAGAAAAPGDPGPSCTFRISGGFPGAKVCWRIEAVRNDRWVRAYGAPVETEKPGAEKGTYQYPELYGQPEARGTLHQTDERGGASPTSDRVTAGPAR